MDSTDAGSHSSGENSSDSYEGHLTRVLKSLKPHSELLLPTLTRNDLAKDTYNKTGPFSSPNNHRPLARLIEESDDLNANTSNEQGVRAAALEAFLQNLGGLQEFFEHFVACPYIDIRVGHESTIHPYCEALMKTAKRDLDAFLVEEEAGECSIDHKTPFPLVFRGRQPT
ncbi:hypothetical protein FZEAL_355 [Fusarium zealandicum]|uniref:Uncharacterized protein n=1 Tax=Fusarium zealandicum TaxID=1053134 RepID=A0A8H4XQH3_9HYPO|nr:hypothetical protein FZEAL_355 [Fusarium zealandicum]